MNAPVATLGDRVVASMPSFSSAERRAARALLARYPTTGMETVALFAERAKVSGPTILRFVTKLGFPSYPEFRRALREEMEKRAEYSVTPPPVSGTSDALSVLGASLADAVQRSIGMAGELEIARLTEVLVDERRQIFLLGGDYTEPAAQHLEFYLRKMRGRIRMLSPRLMYRADELAEIKKRDVVILFDIRRYQADTITTAEIAKSRGAVVVLFTDQWMSSVAQVADFVMRAHVDVPSPWDSLIGFIALVEVLALSIAAKQWPNAKSRYESTERIRAKLTP